MHDQVSFNRLSCCAAGEGQDIINIDITEGSYVSTSSAAELSSPPKRSAPSNARVLGVPFDGEGLVHRTRSNELGWRSVEAAGGSAMWGRFRHRDGGMYVGESVAGRRHGQGTFSWADGSTFVGMFQDDSMDGDGLYTWADGRRYKGQWKASQMSGCGTFLWPDGRKYEGQYAKDAKEGTGKFSWPDGRQYNGGWKNGRQHGRGIIRGKEGAQYMGTWCDGRCMSMLEAPKDHSRLKEGRKCTVDIGDVAEEAEGPLTGASGYSKRLAPMHVVGDVVCHPSETANASDAESFAEDGSEDSLPLPYTQAGFSLGPKEAVSSMPKLDLVKVQEDLGSSSKAKSSKSRKEGSKSRKLAIGASTLQV